MPALSPKTVSRTNEQAMATWRIGDGDPPPGAYVALVPGSDTPLLSVALPDTLRGRARQDVALRQILDRLGSKAEDLDIRPAMLRRTDGWAHVVVADRSRVLEWRASVSSGCRAIVPDYAALPVSQGLWTLDFARGVLRARLGPANGFTAEAALAASQLRLALTHRPRAVLWLGETDPDLMAVMDGLPVYHAVEALPEDLRPVHWAHGELALDFSHDSTDRARLVERGLRLALWPALFALTGAASWSMAQVLEIRANRTEAASIRAATVFAARRDVLGSVPIVDLQRQTEREIDRRRRATVGRPAEINSLDLLRIATGVLAQSHGRVLSIRMGDDVGGVVIDLKADDFRALEILEATLIDAGLSAEVRQSAIDPDGGVTATIAVTAAAAGVGGEP